MKSLLQLDLNLTPEYKDFIDDLMKFATFQTVTHILTNLNTGTTEQLFNGNFLKGLIFLLIGIAVYHLVIKKLFNLVYSDDSGDGYIPTIKLFSN